MSASTLGPRTGGWASGCCDSYVGGELKCAGYDMIVIEGKAHRPVYIWIQDDLVEIREASHLWGKTTWETLDTFGKISRTLLCMSFRSDLPVRISSAERALFRIRQELSGDAAPVR